MAVTFIDGLTVSGASTFSSTLTLSSIAGAGEETVSALFEESGVVKKRNLGENAFNSTTIPTNAVLTSGNQTVAGAWVPGFTTDFGFIGTNNMSGLEYCMLSNGTDTFLGAGTSGKLKLRGPANDSSPSIVIDGTSVTVDDGASVGTGAIRAKYNSSDNSTGITTTVGVKNASQSSNLTLTIKDGIIVGVS